MLLERILPMVSIALALFVLLVLIAVSTSPAAEVYRAVDVKTQYLSDVAVVLDQQLVVSSADASEEQSRAVAGMAASLPDNVNSVRQSLARLQAPSGWIGLLRALATSVFNLIDGETWELGDPARLAGPLSELDVATDRISQHVEVYLQNRLEFDAGLARFAVDVRSVVQQLRSTGRDDLADQIFRAGNQIHAYAASGEMARLEQIEVVRQRLQFAVESLSATERADGAELLEASPLLVDARRAMGQSLRLMDVAGLAGAVSRFREDVTHDRVRALSMISDARVLLNLYTVFLLIMLGYLGLRLRASYSELNRSHDDLELRVHERTADLELAYDDLKESQVQLVQAEKMSSLGQLVAGVMHEINTPLLYALNNTTMTSETIAELDSYLVSTLPLLEARCADEVKQAVQAVLKQRNDFDVQALRESAEEVESLNKDTIEGLNQISDLVQSLKDFSRLDRATEDRFNICDGIEKTLTITKNLLKYGIEIEKDFQDVGEILCSPARINQIFVNLVTNAAQAMNGEGTLRISVREIDDWVEVTFQDTGCGISDEDLARVTDPFFTTKPVGQGTGLGLSIVHQIVQQHRGDLDIQSEIGKGTSITLRLPRQPHKDEEAA